MALKYLWHSAQYESASRGQEGKFPSIGRSFGSGARRSSIGFCIYIDGDGDPVRVTTVTSDNKPCTSHKDTRLVGIAEDAVCLVGNTGYFGDNARDWCSGHGIEPSLNGLLQYMGTRQPFRTHLKVPVKVGKAIKLKK